MAKDSKTKRKKPSIGRKHKKNSQKSRTSLNESLPDSLNVPCQKQLIPDNLNALGQNDSLPDSLNVPCQKELLPHNLNALGQNESLPDSLNVPCQNELLPDNFYALGQNESIPVCLKENYIQKYILNRR